VLIARWQSGFRVVYKPKPLAVDQHFQDLLGWLNARGASPGFRRLRILDRGDYGWEEFVAPAGCSSAAEVERFYRRQGGYLAVLYALGAADFHYENVIAAGEHPVLIDLEALFHPSIQAADPKPADHLAGHSLDESVLGAGLLPVGASQADMPGHDLSGIGAEPGQGLPWRCPDYTGLGTDDMRFFRREDVIASADHRPTLHGATVQPLESAAAIEAGFREVYELLARHRGELLAAGGPLERFGGDEVRVLLRPTSRYREFLDEGFHPDVLRDALDRDQLFDRLWEEVPGWPPQGRLIPAEVEDLWRGDVPRFTTRPGSRDLWASAGQQFTDFFAESGMEEVRRRLDRLGDPDLARQIRLLRSSLATLVTGTGAGTSPGYQLTEGGPAADRDRLLAGARAVGDRLAEWAEYGTGGDVSWAGLSLGGEERWSLLPLRMDLYDGLPGLALFLAYLGARTGEERYTALARGTLRTMQRRLVPEKRHKTVQSIGGFAGWGGVLYTLAHLGALWGEPELLTEAEELVSVLPDLIERDTHLDVVGGAAGCLAGLLCLHCCAPSARVLAAAVRCGDHLLARARPMPRGCGWDPAFRSGGPLTGFSHGAAGIAWALLELAAQTGAERFRTAAGAGIDYERSLFSARAGNWPDLRLFEAPPEPAGGAAARYSVTWCHGAPGIGLARLLCLPHAEGPELRAEIEVALRTTAAHGFGESHILCHGDLGNLELLLEAARAWPESPWRAEADRLASGVLNSIERDGRLCANPLDVESPGLMTGIAGIGYGLLRLADPDWTPSVLSLAPPVSA
jgi:type 2 lantibiotic biosynthesis protein LanM